MLRSIRVARELFLNYFHSFLFFLRIAWSDLHDGNPLPPGDDTVQHDGGQALGHDDGLITHVVGDEEDDDQQAQHGVGAHGEDLLVHLQSPRACTGDMHRCIAAPLHRIQQATAFRLSI